MITIKRGDMVTLFSGSVLEVKSKGIARDSSGDPIVSVYAGGFYIPVAVRAITHVNGVPVVDETPKQPVKPVAVPGVPLLPAHSLTTLNTIHNMDALMFLRGLPDNFVDCIVTSPPYFGLRDYGVSGQMGLEKSPAEYVVNMVRLFREARRVLKPEGNFWLNIGDSYAANRSAQVVDNKHKFVGNDLSMRVPDGLKPKDLMLIPHRLAIALQDDGWWVRQDNVWHKPNPMPESVTDRTTRAHEYVFHLTKSERYYYDAESIKEPVKPHSIKRQGRVVSADHKNASGAPEQTPHSMFKPRENINKQDALGKRQYTGFNERYDGEATPMANRRSVWTITPANYRDAHFATFPEQLAEICILAGCPPGGLVLDMFMGAGTTALVARKHRMSYTGSELNPEYVAIALDRLRLPFEKRCVQKPGKPLSDLPMFSVDFQSGMAGAGVSQ